MAKKLLVLLMCLTLVGCIQQPKDNQDIEKPTLVDKVDTNKDYIYVETTDEHDLRSIIEKSHFNSEWVSFDADRKLLNQKIRINIDSEDARNVENELSDKYLQNKDLRAKASNDILNEASFFRWNSQYIYETYESENSVSVFVYTEELYYPGHKLVSVDSYVFNKSEGKLLTNNEILELAGTSASKIEEYIVNDFNENTVTTDGKDMTRKLVKSVQDIQRDAMDIAYYRIKLEKGLIISDNDVYVILEQYLGIDDDFNTPSVYKISLKDIK